MSWGTLFLSCAAGRLDQTLVISFNAGPGPKTDCMSRRRWLVASDLYRELRKLNTSCF